MKGQPAMIGLKKDADNDTTVVGDAPEEATTASPRSDSSPASPELKPPPRAGVSLPEKPRRPTDKPNGRARSSEEPRRSERPRGSEKPRSEETRTSEKPRRSEKPSSGEGKTLVIGRDIVLSGRINACDRLVVEGQVEAKMKDCREIEIAETGAFKGQVEFDRADISGIFEGDLTAREHLVVRATGRITGKVRFGELEIERGGQIVGDVQIFGEEAPPAHDAENANGKAEK